MESLLTIFYILQWILFSIFFIVLVLMFVWMISGLVTLIKRQTPFLPVPLEFLPDISKAISPSEGSVVYDLGSGDGRVLEYLAKQNIQAVYIGIDNGIFPFIISKISIWLHKRKLKGKIKLKFKNFFEEDLSNATHVFMYLRPYTMDSILPKLEEELKPGSKVISIFFKFGRKRSSMEIPIKNVGALERKIYIYEF